MIDILFENNDIVVCVKPIGIVSQSDKTTDLVALLSKQLNCKIYPIHRLDVAVGGTMVFAKNSVSAADLSAQILNGDFKKRYLAVISGVPQEDCAVLTDLLFKDSSKNKSFVVKRERKGVKRASLEYEVIGKIDNASLISVLLHTGRTHQIRVQFASRKMPLIGDGKYGSRDNRCSVALWSSEIEFVLNSKTVKFESLPDFTQYPWSLFSGIL